MHNAKRLLASREIFSYLLCEVVDEVKENYTREEVYSTAGYKNVDMANADKDKPLYVDAKNSDSLRIGGKDMSFDVLTVLPCKDGLTATCFVDMEMQNKVDLKYELEHRALVYFARLIDESVFDTTGDDSYIDMHKVFSVWILRDKNSENKITRYKIAEDGRIKNHIMDFMEIVIIRFNDEPSGKGDIFDFLEGLLVEKNKERKHEKISRFVNLDNYIVKEMSDMGKYSAIIEDNAVRKTEDKTSSIVGTYMDCQDIDTVVKVSGYPREEVVRVLVKYKVIKDDKKENMKSKKEVAIPDSLKDEYNGDYGKYLDDIFNDL